MEETLEASIQKLSFDVPAGSSDRLGHFIRMLEKWNRVYNLTSVRDPRQMVTRHILDSLVVAPWLQGTRILDVGSGAGLPGIPLAVILPDKQFVLLDSNSKKTRFMQQAVAELELENVEVMHSRVEKYAPGQVFDTIISRAFSNIGEYVQAVSDMIAPDGCILAMKGVYPIAELDNVPADFQVQSIEQLKVPGLEAERHLVILRRVQEQ